MSMRRNLTYALLLTSVMGLGCVAVPPARPEADLKRVSLDQGWSDADRRLFQHQSQGSAMVPYEDRKSTRLNSSHIQKSRMPSSA